MPPANTDKNKDRQSYAIIIASIITLTGGVIIGLIGGYFMLESARINANARLESALVQLTVSALEKSTPIVITVIAQPTHSATIKTPIIEETPTQKPPPITTKGAPGLGQPDNFGQSITRFISLPPVKTALVICTLILIGVITVWIGYYIARSMFLI